MNINNIIRAWKDEDYRLSLTAAERAMLPENPAGIVELSDSQLGVATGAGLQDSVWCTASSICPCLSAQVNCYPKSTPPAKK